MKSLVSSVWNGITSLISSAMNGIKNAVSQGVNAVKQFFVDMGSSIVRTVTELGSQMFSMGADMIRGLMNGIKSMAGAAVKAVEDVVGGAVNGAKKLLHIGSPSRLFRQFGIWTGEGYVIGLDRKQNDVERAMTAMVSPVTPKPIQVPKVSTADIGGGQVGALTGGLTVNVTGQESMSPDHFGRRFGESFAATVGSVL